MKKNCVRLFAILLMVCMILASVSGCADSGKDTEEGVGSSAAAESNPAGNNGTAGTTDNSNGESKNNAVTYPLEGETKELSLFYLLNEYGFDAKEMAIWAALEEATNVYIDMTWVSAMLYGDQFAIMVNSGELPDLVRNASNQFISGLDYAVEQDIIVPLNDYLEDYMPDFYSALLSDDNYMDAVVTGNGYIAEANALYYEAYGPQYGFVIRQDYLDEIGMDIPVTYDDWTEVLTAFKTMGVESPLWLSNAGAFTGDLLGAGFGAATMVASNKYPIYNVDGVVRFGPIESGYYDYLELVSGWYADGLISADFATDDHYMFPMPPGVAASGKYGIWCTMLGMFDQYANLSDSENFKIVALPDAVKNEGDINHLGFDIDYALQASIAVTTGCDDIETACKWINYGYTEAGILLYNYGVEGQGFEYDSEGNPQYTDLVLNNPDGLTFSAAQFRYAGGDNSPTIINYRSAWSAYSEDAVSAMNIWGSASDGAYELPSNLTLTTEELSEFASIYADIETYITEYVLRFITGDTALSDYDKFVDTIESMNIGRCIEIYQAALDRALSK